MADAPDCPDETSVVEFVHGLLDAEAATSVETHIAACASCRMLVAELVKLSFAPTLDGSPDETTAPPSDPATTPRGARVGRYQITDRIGAGGMGVVFAAWDPELERSVAVKLLRPVVRAGAARRARLAREAQIMARLAHPNVCAVYDAGTFAGQVYVVMELVAGPTLRAWLADAQRPWREVRDAFVAAARGIAAAHAIGVVHRDFKPDNALLGGDGRIRVTDFGLARADDDIDADRGALIGTPAYMAPEQLAREPATARSDQYALCVALDEALASRPHPAWLRRVLARGMARDPEARYPSMEALVAALTIDTRRRRYTTIALSGCALGVTGLAIALATRGASDPSARCDTGATELAGVWDPARRGALHDAFHATRAAFADASFATIARRLDAWASDWTALRRDACVANATGRQSSTLMDLRLACLDERRDEVRALGDILAKSDAHALEGAVDAAFGLSPVASCSDPARLVNRPPPPVDPAARATLHALDDELARAIVLERAGHYADGVAIAARMVARARAAGLHPAIADGLVELGALQDKAGQASEAEATLRDAIREAEAARTDDVLARARLHLLWTVCVSNARFGELAALRADAEAAITRVGGDELMRADLLHEVGSIETDAGQLDDARTALEHAAEIRARRLGDHPDLAQTLNVLAQVYHAQGRADDSERTLRRTLDLQTRLLGPDHPEVADTLNNLGNLAFARGAPADALALYERALPILETTLGPDHPDVAAVVGSMAGSLSALGRHDEAIAHASRAVAILDRPNAPPTPAMAHAHQQLAGVQGNAGRPADAIVHLQRSLVLVEQTVGHNSYPYALGLINLGDAYAALGKRADARTAHEQAATLAEAALGADNPRLGIYLAHLAFDRLAGDRPSDAIVPLDRALHLQDGTDGVDPMDLAQTEFALARALDARGRGDDRTRAVALASRAAEIYAANATPDAQNELSAVRAWLATHAPRR